MQGRVGRKPERGKTRNLNCQPIGYVRRFTYVFSVSRRTINVALLERRSDSDIYMYVCTAD